MGKEAEDRQRAGIVTWDFSEEAAVERLRATAAPFPSETPPNGAPDPSALGLDNPGSQAPQRVEKQPFGSLLWQWLKARWAGGRGGTR